MRRLQPNRYSTFSDKIDIFNNTFQPSLRKPEAMLIHLKEYYNDFKSRLILIFSQLKNTTFVQRHLLRLMTGVVQSTITQQL